MYLEHFQLARQPFSMVPSAANCIMAPGFKREYNRCVQGIEQLRGPVLVVGRSGCGKSTMLAAIERQFTDSLRTIVLNSAMIGSRLELVQCVMFELGLPYESENLGQIRLRLMDHLKSPRHCPRGLLLLVDEAHLLTTDVLEELRMMTNLVCAGRTQVRLVIAGSHGLEEKLAELESFNQRIGVRCGLAPMTRTDTMLFALGQIQLCGRDGREIFLPTALEEIHKISEGIQRVVCQVCDTALQMAAERDEAKINGDLIQLAWCELHQLPLPESRPESLAKHDEDSPGIVEFGSLDDEPGQPRQRTTSTKPAVAQHPAMATIDAGNDDDGADDSESTINDLLQQLHDIEARELPVDKEPPRRMEPDSSQLFGETFEQDEPVVDIQSQRTADLNRRAAALRVEEVPELQPPPPRRSWTLMEPEIVCTTMSVADLGSLNLNCAGVTTSDDQPAHLAEQPGPLAPRKSPQPSSIPMPAIDAPAGEVSPGQAIRMEYHELFRQLQSQTSQPGP